MLDLEESSLAECQQYLLSLADPDAPALGENLSERDLSEVITQCKTWQNIEFSADERTIIPKYVARILSTILNATSLEVSLTAIRALLHLLSLSAASAMGCHSYNIFHALYSNLHKIILQTIKTPEASKVTKKSKAKHSDDDEEEDDADDNMDTNVDNADEEEGNLDIEFSLSQGRSHRTTRQQQITKATGQLTRALFKDFTQTLANKVEVLGYVKDEELLFSMAEVLLNCLYLSTIRSELQTCATFVRSAIVKFTSVSGNTLMAMHRAMIPLLTMNMTRSCVIPDNQKVRKACHVALQEAYQEVLHVVLPLNLTMSKAEEDLHNSSLMQSPVGKAFPSTQDDEEEEESKGDAAEKSAIDADVSVDAANAKDNMPLVHVCMMGLLQRMIITCPDRAPVRAIVSQTIVDLISCIAKMRDSYKSSSASADGTDKSLSNQCQEIIHHFVNFVTKVSKSNRIPFRAFSLEVMCMLLMMSWFWEASNDNTGSTLLVALMYRCEDASPSVRLRAISAFQDFLDQYHEDSTEMMIRAMYDLILGFTNANNGVENTQRTKSLADVLRQLTADEKTLVRSKAMQVYAMLLTKTWYKLLPNGSKEEISLHIAEEDLTLFTQGCRDESISVRKQALQSLSMILLSKPYHDAVMLHWIQAVLPLALDPEVSIVQKLAQQLQVIVFDTISTWKDVMRNTNGRGISSKEFPPSASYMLGWQVIYHIASMGLLPLLKSSLAYMLKQGCFSFSTREQSNSMNFYLLMQSCKQACCLLLTPSDHVNNAAMTSEDQVVVSQAAWILLECIVTQSHVKCIDANNNAGNPIALADALQKVGSADFVIECYRSKHPRQSNSQMSVLEYIAVDEEDIRMLKVLDKMAMNLPKQDIQEMMIEMDQWLLSLSLPAEVSSIAIQLRYQLSKALANNVSNNETDFGKAYCDDVQSWTSKLVHKIYHNIYAYIFHQMPSNTHATTNSILALLSNGPESTKVVDYVHAALYLLGEVVMLGFHMEEGELKANQRRVNFAQSGQLDYLFNPDNLGFRLLVPKAMLDLVQMCMGTTLPHLATISMSQSSSAEGEDVRECPVKIRATSFVTMGKCCLRDHILAREQMNVFLRELHPQQQQQQPLDGNVSQLTDVSSSRIDHKSASKQSSVRSNALLVLGDLCIRHTHLVDRHMDSLACCLQDSDAQVRKHALLLLTQLLVQDFVKWKGLLLYRFLMLVVDEDVEIAMFAQDILTRTLSLKYSGLLHSHFSEAFMIFNKCNEHPIYSAIAWASSRQAEHDDNKTAEEEDDMAAEGAASMDPNTLSFHQSPSLTRGQRFAIYHFMANDLTDEMKIQVTAKLVNDILASAVDNSKQLLPDRSKFTASTTTASGSKKQLNANKMSELTPFETAMEDVFSFLRSAELKIGSKRGGAGNGADEGEALEESAEGAGGSHPQQALAAAKTKILKTLSSQHLVSHVLPVVMSLKHCLEATKSPLQGALMDYLMHLVKFHKSEVDQVLQNDPTLKAEVDYDLRQYEKAKKETQRLKEMKALSAEKKAQAVAAASAMHSGKKDNISPYFDAQEVHPSTIKKPLLKAASSSSKSSLKPVLPIDAMEEALTIHSVRKVILSSSQKIVQVASSAKRPTMTMSAQRALANSQYDEDPYMRLAASQDDFVNVVSTAVDDAYEQIRNEGWMLEDNEPIHNSNANTAAEISSASKNYSAQKRRSWGVVVNSLSEEQEEIEPAVEEPVSRKSIVPTFVEENKTSKSNSNNKGKKVSKKKSLKDMLDEVNDEDIVEEAKEIVQPAKKKSKAEEPAKSEPIVAVLSEKSMKVEEAVSSKEVPVKIRRNAANNNSSLLAVVGQVKKKDFEEIVDANTKGKNLENLFHQVENMKTEENQQHESQVEAVANVDKQVVRRGRAVASDSLLKFL